MNELSPTDGLGTAAAPSKRDAPPCAPELYIGRRGTLDDTPVEILGWTQWLTDARESWYEVVLRTEEGAWWLLEYYGGHWMVHQDFKKPPTFEPRVQPGDAIDYDRRRIAYPAEVSTLQQISGEYFRACTTGDRVEFRPFFGGSTVITAQRDVGALDAGRWEWSRGAYLDGRALGKAFEIDLPSGANGVPHPARPYPSSAWGRALPLLFVAAAVLSVLAMVLIPTGKRGQLLTKNVPLSGTSGEVFVGAFDSDGPQAISIQGDALGLNNEWLYVRYVLATVPEGDSKEASELAAIAAEYGSYSGFDSEGGWTERDTKSREGIGIETGSYAVVAQWERGPTAKGDLTLRVAVNSGYRSLTPLLIWLVVCAAGAIIMLGSRAAHRRRVGIHWDLIEEYDP